MKKALIDIFRILARPFLGQNLGDNYFTRKIIGILIDIVNPVAVQGGGKIYLPQNGIDYIIKRYEEFNIALLKENLKEGDIFVDIGAGVGYYSVIASRLVGFKGKVLAFDPAPECSILFKKNIIINDCQNVEFFQKAVSGKTGATDLYLYEDRAGSNRLADVAPFIKEGPKIQVETIKLDDFYKGKIDFLKIDVEGSEFLALDGMKDLLAKNQNIKILTEMPDFKAKEYLELLEELKFKIFEINKEKKNIIPAEYFKNIINRKETTYLFCKR